MPELDGLRGLAILSVMAFHFVSLLPEDLASQGSLGKLLVRACASGWIGVDLFFVLSGFLITGILDDSRQSPRFFRSFYARRALRIFPLYYGVLAAAFLVLPALGSAGAGPSAPIDNQAWFWLYGVNFLRVLEGPGSCGNLEHFWSLAVEEHFYLLWPVTVYYARRAVLMRICIAVIAVALAARVLSLSLGSAQAAYMLSPCRIDAMAVGSLLALAVRGPRGIAGVVRHARLAGTISGLLLAALVLGHHGLFGHLMIDVQLIGYPALAAFSGSILILGVSSSPATLLSKSLRSSPLRFVGKYSYGMYVYHFIIASILVDVSPSWDLEGLLGSALAGGFVVIAIAVATTMALAWVSWHVLEKHALSLKRYFPT